MEQGFSKWALFLGLSLLLVSKTGAILVNVIKGENQTLEAGAILCNPDKLLFIHTKKCKPKCSSKFEAILKNKTVEGNWNIEDHSYKFTENVKGCLLCLGRCHVKLAKDNRQGNHNNAKKKRYESYECYKPKIIFKLLKDHKHPGTDASNFQKFYIPILNREGNGDDYGQNQKECSNNADISHHLPTGKTCIHH